MDEPPLARLIEAMNATISSHAVQLDALDEAIGDGDHGTNLARGFAALAAERARLGALPLGQGLQEAGTILERETGGAGGKYYGLICRAMGAAASDRLPAPGDLLAVLEAGIAAAEAEGGAKKGDKTLLDVLIPVAQGLRMQLAEGRADQIGARITGRRGPWAACHHPHAGQARAGGRSGRRQREPAGPRRLLLRIAVRGRGRSTGAQPGSRLSRSGLTKPSSAGCLSDRPFASNPSRVRPPRGRAEEYPCPNPFSAAWRVARGFLLKLWKLTAPYWWSEERWFARGMLALIVALNIFWVYLLKLLNDWNGRIFNALQDKNQEAFLGELKYFALLVAILIVNVMYRVWLRQLLGLRWRQWLTRSISGDLARRAHLLPDGTHR